MGIHADNSKKKIIKQMDAGLRCDSCGRKGTAPWANDTRLCVWCHNHLSVTQTGFKYIYHCHFSVTVATLGGDRFKVYFCKNDDLIRTVKKKIYRRRSSLSKGECELLLNGSVLKDGKSLRDSGVVKHSCLHIIWKDAPDSDSDAPPSSDSFDRSDCYMIRPTTIIGDWSDLDDWSE